MRQTRIATNFENRCRLPDRVAARMYLSAVCREFPESQIPPGLQVCFGGRGSSRDEFQNDQAWCCPTAHGLNLVPASDENRFKMGGHDAQWIGQVSIRRDSNCYAALCEYELISPPDFELHRMGACHPQGHVARDASSPIGDTAFICLLVTAACYSPS